MKNRLLSRFTRRRLDAEQIRDAMLAAAGIANGKAGGPSVMVPVDAELVSLLYKPSQWRVTSDPVEHNRRSIYLFAKRNLRLPFLEVFDQPSLQTSCFLRVASTHAPQSLEMLNGRVANEMATSLQQKVTALQRLLDDREQNGAEPTTPLCAHRHRGRWAYVTTQKITDILRRSAAALPELEPT